MNSFVVISAKVISICNVFSLSFFLFVKLDDPFFFILRYAINKNIFKSKKKYLWLYYWLMYALPYLTVMDGWDGWLGPALFSAMMRKS